MADLTTAKKLYRIFNWASLAALILVIILVLRKSPPPAVPYDPAAAKRVEQKFAAADQAKAAGQPAQVQMNGTELNSYLAQNLQLQGSPAQPGSSVPAPAASLPAAGTSPATNGSAEADPLAALASNDPQTIEQVQSSVKDVKVDMDGDLVKAYVIFDFHGKDLSLELDGHLSAENGYVKFDPVAGKLGSMPLPQSTLEAAVSKMMSSPENREKLKLPDDISGIQIVNGNAVLSYK
ncbi:MAG TPA: hypothetical protein VG322_01970 [Candidatus Acidoferrales bacterium]|jgi:hypothetical protein|nr:hypothetical protein [Candidatus Acidoferrales bacterium]